MRIIYLHQYFNLPSMTGGTRSYEMARRMVAAGHDVHMVTSRRDSESGRSGWTTTQHEGINVHWLDVSYRNDMGFHQRLAAFVRFAREAGRRAVGIGGDVIFASSTPLTIALPGVHAARKLTIPMVFEVRDLWPEMPIAMGALRSPLTIYPALQLEKYAYRHAQRIVALSPGMAEGVAARGYPSEQISVIPNSCDVDLFRVPSAQGERFLDEHPALRGGPRVFYGGTFGRVNGLSYMVEIASAMLAIDPSVRFVAAGEGGLKQAIIDDARRAQVYEKNFWILPSMAKQDMPGFLSAATVATSFVVDLEAAWKNSANKFFDALAAGRPIAINHEGWQADILRSSGAGLVMPARDPRAAAMELHDRLTDTKWLETASTAASTLADERFDRDRLAALLIEVLEGVVAQRPAD
ncbi:MAG: glycosyltransferase family 4 protein [Gammaproteobacteria bacterium]